MTKPLIERSAVYRWLVEHSTYQGTDCLPWPYFRDKRVGRGMCNFEGKSKWAHRVICEMAHGAPPTPRHQAAHNCGKGHEGCVNPRHLEWKTNAENQRDRIKHGNGPKCGKPRRRITDEQVEQLRALADQHTQMELAEMFGLKLGGVQYYLKYRVSRGYERPEGLAISYWTPAEDAKLRDGVARGLTQAEIAELVGRTKGAVNRRLLTLKQQTRVRIQHR